MHKYINTAIISIFLLLTTGCASFNTHQPIPVRLDARIIISQVPLTSSKYAGMAWYLEETNTCIISLAQYPRCLLHEIRHCFEGNWHEGVESDEDC